MTGASLPGHGHVTLGPTHAGRLSLERRDLGEITGPSRARCSLRGGCRRPGLPGAHAGRGQPRRTCVWPSRPTADRRASRPPGAASALLQPEGRGAGNAGSAEPPAPGTAPALSRSLHAKLLQTLRQIQIAWRACLSRAAPCCQRCWSGRHMQSRSEDRGKESAKP